MKILGINSVYHESSACLLIDGAVQFCMEEERLSRFKHAKTAEIHNPDALPLLAIECCLKHAGLALKDIDHIGFSFQPERRLKNKEIEDRVIPGSWGSAAGENLFYEKLQKIPGKLCEMGFKGRFHWIEHAMSHAASAFFPSPFAEAGIISIDGIGEVESVTLSRGEQDEITTLWDLEYPHSLGFLWEKMALFLGYSAYDAGKVMSLGSYGNPSRYARAFGKIVQLDGTGKFHLDKDILRFRTNDFHPLETLFGVPRREADGEVLSCHLDLAAGLQALTNEIMLGLSVRLHRETGSPNLCLAGGVALNCVANRYMFEKGPFDRLYIQPATHDGGTSLGAALYLWNRLKTGQTDAASKPLTHTYFGPCFSDEAIRTALQAGSWAFDRPQNLEREVARLICEGHVVGWFQGRMEYGPRALGNRSLLADPRDPGMKDRLNLLVKHRENYRPFCPSVLDEDAKSWFRIEKPTPASDFMLMAYPVVRARKDRIPSAIHVDGTSRIQTVRPETNPRFHQLITEFKKLTGVPMLINTSFNDGEPIVCSPEDALQTLRKTGIDYLAIGDFLVKKPAGCR